MSGAQSEFSPLPDTRGFRKERPWSHCCPRSRLPGSAGLLSPAVPVCSRVGGALASKPFALECLVVDAGFGWDLRGAGTLTRGSRVAQAPPSMVAGPQGQAGTPRARLC